MMELLLHRSFRKKFKKLSPHIREQFFIRAELFKMDKFNPTLNNHSVEKAYPGCRSINITGDYRAIFYEETQVLAVFINIGTHAELYR